MTGTDSRVELTDLDVIARYSLAVRTATADRDELILALRSDLEWLQGGRVRRTSTATPSPTPAPARAALAEPAVEAAPPTARARRAAQPKKTAPVKKATSVKKTAAVKKKTAAVKKKTAAVKKTAPATKVAQVKQAPADKKVSRASSPRKKPTMVKWADSPRRPAARSGRGR